MAQPRVFISSTCYDLGEVRHSLEEFLKGFGYGVVLSEEGDVYYNPDFHTHDSCINEIPTCNLFILIIGGRHGGKYVGDKTKSITNAEYDKAKELNIPIFTFVKKDVISDHRVFQKNKTKDIEYPSIEKQENSKAIFKFIDDIRLADKNNEYFIFENISEIREMLKKQFAGMMFDFLAKRNKNSEHERTNRVLDNLTQVQKKTEEILENIYKKVDSKQASEKIKEIDNEILAENFFLLLFKEFKFHSFLKPCEEIANLSLKGLDWIKFLLRIDRFFLDNDYKFFNSSRKVQMLFYENNEGFLYSTGHEVEEIFMMKVKLLMPTLKDILKPTKI